jgi:hypothetical protein
LSVGPAAHAPEHERPLVVVAIAAADLLAVERNVAARGVHEAVAIRVLATHRAGIAILVVVERVADFGVAWERGRVAVVAVCAMELDRVDAVAVLIGVRIGSAAYTVVHGDCERWTT